MWQTDDGIGLCSPRSCMLDPVCGRIGMYPSHPCVHPWLLMQHTCPLGISPRRWIIGGMYDEIETRPERIIECIFCARGDIKLMCVEDSSEIRVQLLHTGGEGAHHIVTNKTATYIAYIQAIIQHSRMHLVFPVLTTATLAALLALFCPTCASPSIHCRTSIAGTIMSSSATCTAPWIPTPIRASDFRYSHPRAPQPMRKT